MSNKVKKIGILTSGGDGPGMNAAIRAAVRSGLHYGVEMVGVMRGYQGILDEDFVPLNHRSVSNIINKGGTILKTARSKEFGTDEGKAKAADILHKYGIDSLIVIGGDGSYRGASQLYAAHGIATVGLPGTIDNDINGTDQTIGCATAINTALESIDKIRDTAQSMERIFVVEVMGNKSGYIAMEVALAAGAEDVIIPERTFDYAAMHQEILKGNTRGKISYIILVAEGSAMAPVVAENITRHTGLETRYVVLGHVQRGGTPLGPDRILGTRLGAAAVDLLLSGVYGKAVGVLEDEINIVDLKDASRRIHADMDERYKLLKMLT